jgi:alkaline phosphatase D
MKSFIFVLPVIFLFILGCEKKIEDQVMGEFAPPDAFLEGEEHAYYGSENPWNRRFFTEHIKNYYKRRGQRQMLDIMEGRADEAASYCRQLLKDDPNDLESLFNLSIALAQTGNNDSAFIVLTESLGKGLPFGRYLAGPRELMSPLYKDKRFQELSKKYNIKLIHGPMLGDVTANSARFWVRTATESDIQVIVSRDEKFEDSMTSSPVQSKADADYTAIVSISRLKANTKYFYNLKIDDKLIYNKDFPSFRTYPESGSKTKISVGFGGGAGFVPESERIWDVIQAHHPYAFLFMGDNVYINMPEFPNALHDYTYYRRQSRPEFRRLVSSVAAYAIWDDHDAATDDVWLGPYKDKPAWKLPLLEKFKQNWNNPYYGSEEWPAVWNDFSIGDVDFFMLDGRIYRTNPFKEEKTMLGPAQKEWLFNNLKKSDAKFKVIASPVPWAFDSKAGARDTWNGFQAERNEIFDFLAENKINGVILISADRHRSDAWKLERTNGYPLYEFESSRLTNQHFHELIPQSLFGYNEKQSFGYLTFDLTQADPTVTFEIYSIDNEMINSLTLKLSEISHE